MMTQQGSAADSQNSPSSGCKRSGPRLRPARVLIHRKVLWKARKQYEYGDQYFLTSGVANQSKKQPRSLAWSLPWTHSDLLIHCMLCLTCPFAAPAGGGFSDPEEDSGGHEFIQSKPFVLLSLLGSYHCTGSFGLANGFILRHRVDHNSPPCVHPCNFPGKKQQAQSIPGTQGGQRALNFYCQTQEIGKTFTSAPMVPSGCPWCFCITHFSCLLHLSFSRRWRH